jgi:TolB-like protein
MSTHSLRAAYPGRLFGSAIGRLFGSFTGPLLGLLMLAGCATVDRGPPVAVDRAATWVVGPFENNTETPLAGRRAEAIAEALLGARGFARVERYRGAESLDALFAPAAPASPEAVVQWAKARGARYLLIGNVDEWRYKVGVDGEPAVGLTLAVIDLQSGETLWRAAGGRAGWSRESLAAVAQQLMRTLLEPLAAAGR